MPTIRRLTVLPAGAQANPLVGDQYEYLPFAALVEIALVSDGAGVQATVFSGTDLIQQQAPVSQKAAPATPVYPDDYAIRETSLAGDRLGVTLINTSGAAVNVNTVVKITPL